MPTLIDSEDIYDDDGAMLALKFNLLGLEVYHDQKTEGWFNYRVALCRGKTALVKREGTIHDGDVRSIVDLLHELQAEPTDFEPLEPDFTLAIHYSDTKEEWVLSCNVNYGEALNRYYGDSAVGVAIVISKAQAKKFAEELESERTAITGGMSFEDYATKPAPKSHNG